MRLRAGALFSLALLVLFLAVPLLADDLPDWMMRTGSVYDAMQKQPRTHVYLDAVVVDKVKAQALTPYFTIREEFAPSLKLVILTPPNPALRFGELLDVEGDLVVLPNGNRGLENVTVWGYADEDGVTLLTHGGPLIKGLLGRTIWDHMIDVTTDYSTTSMSSSIFSQIDALSGEIPNTDSLPGAVFFSSIADLLSVGSSQPQQNSRSQMMNTQTYYDGIGEITGSDGSEVELQCKEITGVGSDGSYFVATDSSGSIPVYCTTTRLDGVTTNDRVNRLIGQLQHVDDDPVICIDDGPNYDPNAVAGPLLQIATAGTIAWARTFSDGDTLTEALTGKLVVASRSDFANNIFYIEEHSRSAAIRVHYSGTTDAARDATVDVTSTIATDSSGERYIEVGSGGSLAISTSSESPVSSVGLMNKDLGGGDYNVLTVGVNTPTAHGLYNIGSLVKCWGVVTGVYQSEKCFYIDDGSNLDDGTDHVKGLKISWAWQPTGNQAISPPALGSYVSVSGISGCESPSSGVVIRTLRVRDNNDIVMHSTPTTTEVDRGLPTSNLNEAAGASNDFRLMM